MEIVKHMVVKVKDSIFNIQCSILPGPIFPPRHQIKVRSPL